MSEALKVIRDKVQDLVFVPRFNDDELNYAVLGSVNARAEEITRLLDVLIDG